MTLSAPLTAESSSIFKSPTQLPHGPHRLSRDTVVESQRTRLMAAAADAVADLGYGRATIAEITKRAGVSPKSFYEHFSDKLDCYLAGYDVLVTTLIEQIGTGLEEGTDWPRFVEKTLAAYLGTMDANRAVARAYLIEIEAAGPPARRRRRDAYARFAALFKTRHEQAQTRDPRLGRLPDRVYLALVHGVRDLVADELDASESPRLTDIGPDALLWVLATTHGARAAAQDLHDRAG